jgi:hypothetical protein
MTSKKCNKCEQTKELNNFSFRSKEKKILHGTCKDCLNNYASQYRADNKELISTKQKKWVNDNQEWYKEYRLSYNPRANELSRERYATDTNYRIKKIIRSRFTKTVKEHKKYSKILNFLGVPLDYFKKWITFQFDEKMNWNNHGTYWDFDHIIPCASFDFSKPENVQKCFVWYNICPLEKNKNNSKSCKIDLTFIANIEKKKNIFISLNPVPTSDSNV